MGIVIAMAMVGGFLMLGWGLFLLWTATPVVFCAEDEYVPKWYLSKRRLPLMARAGIWEIFMIAMGAGFLVSSVGIFIYEYIYTA